MTHDAKSLIIGIAGGSASGKSTFAAALQTALTEGTPPLRVELLNTDRYFRNLESGGPSFVSLSSGELRLDRNRPDSADNPRLAADLTARSAAPDAPDIILVEGLMVLSVPLIRDLLDLRLFVELEEDVRALRRMLRSIERAREPLSIERLESGINYYRESARVGHVRYVEPSRANADFIIRGDSDFGRTSSLVANIVRGRLA